MSRQLLCKIVNLLPELLSCSVPTSFAVYFIFVSLVRFQDESDGVGSPTDSVFSQSSSTHSLYVYECIELALSANAEQEKSIEDTEKFSTETFENKDETYPVKLFKGIGV